MTRFQVMSDIHLEAFGDDSFSIDKALAWIQRLEPKAEILVLAGDIHNNHIGRVLAAFASKWRLVIFVPGNHEYWGQRFKYQRDRFQRVMKEHPNVQILDNRLYTDPVTGLRFCGSTLWFPMTEVTLHKQNRMNDFKRIKESGQIFHLNANAVNFLRDNVFYNDNADIVVTHHAPTIHSITEEYLGDPINEFYFTPILDDQFRECQAKIWIHGHMHRVCDYQHPYGVRVIVNAGGYTRMDQGFDPNRIYEIGDDK